jgi:hypothetical protein
VEELVTQLYCFWVTNRFVGPDIFYCLITVYDALTVVSIMWDVIPCSQINVH